MTNDNQGNIAINSFAFGKMMHLEMVNNQLQHTNQELQSLLMEVGELLGVAPEASVMRGILKSKVKQLLGEENVK